MAFIYFATQIDKCREKVWKKGVEFEEGKKDLSSKGLFPLLKYRPLLGTDLKVKRKSPGSLRVFSRKKGGFNDQNHII